MRKRGLKDVKRRNRQVILEAVMDSGALSRVEIAQKTELAASTVSSQVSQLICDGVLTEGGTVVTAGRSRTELTLNPAYGSIAVIEVGRTECSITCFDMALTPLDTAVLSRHYISGNELLERISRRILCWKETFPRILGIGLLFQEDMRESDFRVIYSTGISSATITLREALMTQYRVPVEEEYSLIYTVSNALSGEMDPAARNSAHISVGNRILASVTLNGKEVPMRSQFCEELLPGLCSVEPEQTGLLHALSGLLALLCILFPLDMVFLSGPELPSGEALQLLRQLAEGKLPSGKLPELKFLRREPVDDNAVVMARQVLRKALVL